MKIILAIMFLSMPIYAAAQTNSMQGMDMQKMMQGMQKIQQCMEKVDQEELNKLESESDAINKEIQTLCEQGKRNIAQDKAIQYSKKLKDNPAMKQMQKCAELAKGLTPPDLQNPSIFEDFDGSKSHICDNE